MKQIDTTSHHHRPGQTVIPLPPIHRQGAFGHPDTGIGTATITTRGWRASLHPDQDIILPEEAVTLPGLFRERLHRSPNAIAYRQFDRLSATWKSFTWKQTAREVGCWQEALKREGLKRGDTVAIMLNNRHGWVVMDQAALGLGLVVVSLYADDRPRNVAHILRDSGAKVLLIRDIAIWNRIGSALVPLKRLKRVICRRRSGERPDDGRFTYLSHWVAPGYHPMVHQESGPDDLATLIYTSGTTGRPKGVMLSHRNLLSNAYGGVLKVTVFPGDRFLSFLPLSHALERTAGYYLPMMAGAEVTYARSVATLAEDILLARPTLLISVPRIYERIHGRLEERLADGSPVARWLFRLTECVGWRQMRHQQGKGPWMPILLLWNLMKKLVADKVLERLGG
ncbi:MAG: AMP-binding protein, partial [Magnetococcales bacterium]|nr:AMP-binding protein [Magnetococcales bacterium]